MVARSGRAVIAAGQVVGSDLRKPHTYKLRLTLLSGAREIGPEGGRGGDPGPANE